MPSDKKPRRKAEAKPKRNKKGKAKKDVKKVTPPSHNPTGGFAKGNTLGTPWKPGQSGNPAGRPPLAKTLSASVRDLLDKPASYIPQIKNMAEELDLDPEITMVRDVLASMHIVQSVERNSAAYLKELYDRVEGKVPDISIVKVSAEEKAEEILDALNNINRGFPEKEDDADDGND